jgi:hypothetical protein
VNMNCFANGIFSNVDVMHSFMASTVGPIDGSHVVIVDGSGFVAQKGKVRKDVTKPLDGFCTLISCLYLCLTAASTVPFFFVAFPYEWAER